MDDDFNTMARPATALTTTSDTLATSSDMSEAAAAPHAAIAAKVVNDLFTAHIHNSVVARDVSVFNYLRTLVPKFEKSISDAFAHMKE